MVPNLICKSQIIRHHSLWNSNFGEWSICTGGCVAIVPTESPLSNHRISIPKKYLLYTISIIIIIPLSNSALSLSTTLTFPLTRKIPSCRIPRKYQSRSCIYYSNHKCKHLNSQFPCWTYFWIFVKYLKMMMGSVSFSS